MSENAPEAPAAPAEAVEPEKPAKAEPDWKAEARKWESRAKDNAKAAERLAQLEESQKSEAQKLAEAKDAAERRAIEAERANLRYRVGLDKKLPAALTDVLQGENEEEMAAHADRLLASLADREPQLPNYDGGARLPVEGGSSMNDVLRRATGRA